MRKSRRLTAPIFYLRGDRLTDPGEAWKRARKSRAAADKGASMPDSDSRQPAFCKFVSAAQKEAEKRDLRPVDG
jgi:hypothetical protein